MAGLFNFSLGLNNNIFIPLFWLAIFIRIDINIKIVELYIFLQVDVRQVGFSREKYSNVWKINGEVSNRFKFLIVHELYLLFIRTCAQTVKVRSERLAIRFLS
jgi:hypothetical protein